MRAQGWPRLLSEYVLAAQEAYKRDGFQWGVNDCVHFAGSWVQTLIGVDPIAEYRGQYSTEAEAFELLSQLDGTLYDALMKRFGEPVHPAKAHRGDLAFIVPDKVGILFTSGARMMGLFLGEGGFVLHRTRDIDHAFRVR